MDGGAMTKMLAFWIPWAAPVMAPARAAAVVSRYVRSWKSFRRTKRVAALEPN